MKKFNCPSCGGEVVFRSNVSVYAVCPYCSSMVVRRDVDVESIGTMAALPDDMSPLQVGTTGVYRKQRFALLGRLKIGWKYGAWNEWFAVFENGSYGWLAEAQGTYAVSFEFAEPLPANTQKAISQLVAQDNNRKVKTFADKVKGIFNADQPLVLGSQIVLNRQKYKIVDIKQAVCAGSEGELPFAAPYGRRSTNIDLLGPQAEFAGIEVADGEMRSYLGHYVEWDELQCNHLRELEGWP